MYILIVNPIAGNGKSMKVYKKLQRHPLFKEKDCRTFFTKYEGHGTELARQLSQMYGEKMKCFIIVGGDGTVHEVINGLTHHSSIHLSYIPAGSGNDFARGLHLKGKPVKLFEQIIQSPEYKPYWFGRFSTKLKKPYNFKLFSSSMGFGFDAEVAKLVNRSRFKSVANRIGLGTLGYVISLLKQLFHFQPKNIDVILDGQFYSIKEAWMVTIASHPYFGGGMKIAPGAKNNPHDFHVVIVSQISKWKILALFFIVFFGKHTKLKEVQVYQARSIEIFADEGIYYHADGQTGRCTHCIIQKHENKYDVHQGKIGSGNP